MISLNVNGRKHSVDAPEEMPLLWVLRDLLNLTGSKFGCGIGVCGACTVHIDGKAERSCVKQVGDVGAAKVVTIEHLGARGLHPVQKAWIEANVPQCGYCQSGFIMAVADLLNAKPSPTDADIDAALTNICRCGTYPQMRKAIHAAAKAMSKGKRA